MTTTDYEQLEDSPVMEHSLADMQPTSIVALFDTDKSQRSSFVMGLLQSLDEGRVDYLKVHKQVKSMEEIITMLTDKKKYPTTATPYCNGLVDAGKKYGEKPFELFNAKWQQKEVGVSYDFSQCNDPELPNLEKAFKEAKDALDARKDFLKNLPYEGIELLDKESGEMVLVMSPAKSSTTTLTISLK